MNPLAVSIEKVRLVGAAANAERYYNVLEKNNYINEQGVSSTLGQTSHKVDFVTRPIGWNKSTGGVCRDCYSHSGYYGNVPKEKLKDIYGNDIGDNPEFDEYTRLWGQKDGVNLSAPKILIKDKDGKFHYIDSKSPKESFQLNNEERKFYENIY